MHTILRTRRICPGAPTAYRRQRNDTAPTHPLTKTVIYARAPTPIAYTETMSNLYPDESISVDKCWERLHANTLGRLILTDGQHVDVLPVLYAVASQDDKQEIYIRTTRGNKFSSVVVSRRVAFEIDETLEDGIRSVIVVGIAHWLPPEMTPQIVRTFDLPDSETHEMQWVRIVPQTVYGREYPLLPAYLDGTHPDSDTLTS